MPEKNVRNRQADEDGTVHHVHVQVDIVEQMNPPGLAFRVRDSGCGMDETQQANLFKVFSNLDAYSTSSGLGLTVSQMIIHHMGGDIKVESQLGSGTTVLFSV